MVNGYIIALTIIVIWTALVLYFKKKGTLEKYNMSNWGPMVMWRTQSGKNIIDRISKPKRFWNIYAAVAKAIVVIAMVFMVALLVWEAFLVSAIPAEDAPGVEMMLGIPGINPLIPIGYGILGLIVAIIVHEYAHGVLTRVANISVKSLGLVFFVFPMGAFVEPDEEGITKTDRKKRMNIYAVGPATNIIVALICALLFSSVVVAAAEPVNDGPVVLSVLDGSPAELSGLEYGCQIVAVNGVAITSLDDWYDLPSVQPGDNITLTYFYDGDEKTVNVTAGVILTGASSGYPAYEAGIRAGMMIISLNDTPILNDQDLKDILSSTVPNEVVNVTVLSYDEASMTWVQETSITNVTLDSKLEYYEDNNVAVADDFVDVGFLGINSAYLGASIMDPDELLAWLNDPYDGVTDASGFFTSSMRYIALPFYGLAPVQAPLTELFEPTGAFEWMGTGGFWIFSNCLYWIFWLNIMVGLTNALPAVPLDGGFIFKDGLDGIVSKFKKNATDEEKEMIKQKLGKITTFLALLIFFLIIWQMIGPRVL
jgi:membrane-associated protease RseP (regulator of RpoE activity)